MSETRFSIEFAKSGRSTCKKCKTKIDKDHLRVGRHVEGGDFPITTWTHVECFALPKAYGGSTSKKTPTSQVKIEDFVDNVLEDPNGNVFPDKTDEVVQAILGPSLVDTTKGNDKEGHSAVSRALQKVKDEWETTLGDDTKKTSQPTKKIKTENGGAASPTTVVSQKVQAYDKYHKETNTHLKDVLKWNKQTQTGTKDFLLAKVLDGVVYGRLARCVLCTGGRLKLEESASGVHVEDGMMVVCSGNFDEDMNRRIPCAFQCKPSEAPRWEPWYEEEPTEEQEKEMERLVSVAKGEEVEGSSAVGAGAENDPRMAELIKAASKLPWDLNSREGIRDATKGMVQILLDQDHPKVDLPSEDKQARQKIGPLLLRHKELSATEMVPILVKEFGFVEEKQAKEVKKEMAIGQMVKNPKNAGIVMAFQELGDLYFKEGNTNAGVSYKKAVAALTDLDFELTADNAMSLCKGKTKVPGVGKKTAEKIKEFYETGTIEKLEEKRADNA